jgi:hypothetical protein
MELTPEKVRELMNALLLKAKQNRAAIPYSKTDAFPNAVVFLGPNLEPASTPITWRDEREKYAKMEAVSKTARDMFCQAVALISDSRWVEEANAVKVLGIPSREEVGMDKYLENYRRVITERYGGYLGNAPKELFTEAIMIAMKGPRMNGPQVVSAPYDKGPNDSIHWLPALTVSRMTHHFDLLPDWWC